jgi:hypothetical protein
MPPLLFLYFPILSYTYIIVLFLFASRPVVFDTCIMVEKDNLKE